MRVEVYFNLHKRVWSVRACSGPEKGRVIEHTDKVLLFGVTFVSQRAGREKVRREGRKNVHAFARGELVATGDKAKRWHDGHEVGFSDLRERPVTYNPYKDEGFVCTDLVPGSRVTVKGGLFVLMGLDPKPWVLSRGTQWGV